jgi:hypothetical protein
MAQQQALLALMERQRAEQQQRCADLEQVLDRTAQDLDQLRGVHQTVMDEVAVASPLGLWVAAGAAYS